jgi:hypothetical protein
MSDPSPSASPLVRQAARNLHRLELMAGNTAWSSNWFYRWNFWRFRQILVQTPDGAAAWLPALAFAVSREKDPYILAELAWRPLPEPLPPEARPWRDRLIRSWEQYRPATARGKTIRLSALVRLDRRVERLPEWLREARRAPDLAPENRHPRLAALAGWRPRPGDGPPHMGSTGVAQAWVRFWEERYRTPGSEPDALIAAAAMLHLAEAGWLPSGPSPERVRAEFRQRVQQVQQWTTSYPDRSVLRMLLSSVPADASSPEQQDIKAWLELTHENVSWEKREAVWDMLAAWQREGVLERSGRGRLPEPPLLLPDLARALKWERDGHVLLAMAGYIPGAAEVSAHPEAARAVIAHWEALSRNDDWEIRQAAWVARWNFLRAGALTAEGQSRFGADDVEAIGAENDRDVLLALARITPPGTFPLATWAGRLSDQNRQCRLAAHLAIHDWLVEVMEGASGEWRVASGRSPLTTRQYGQFPELPLRLATHRRQMRQALRRAGQESTDAGTVAPFVNLHPDVLPDFRRLHEIETALAAGQIPPPDAGAGNRPIPRTVPARLPETQPQMNPPGNTDRAAGAAPRSVIPSRRLSAMSEHHLAVSPLVCQSARNLHRLEVLTANPGWTDLPCHVDFWRAWRVMALTPDEAAAWLPALAFAVSCEKDAGVLAELTRWPLPEPLPPEALPWRDRLIQVWEQYPADTAWRETIRLAALVRLNRRVERLPEWLREARRALDLAPENRHPRLAALAGWRPRPGDGPPHGDKAEAAQAWVRFWEKLYQHPGSQPDGLIAATALLHLAEAGWLPSGPSPERLREECRQRVQQWSMSTYQDMQILRMLLSSVPADASAPEQQQQDIMAWLELTHRNVRWEKREAVWDMLAAWQREGILERSGRVRLPEPPLLLPDLARALEREAYGSALLAMAGYVPRLAEVSTRPEAARAVVAHWEAHSRDDYWGFRLAAWVARWNLLRAGVLTAEEEGRFGSDYVEAIGSKDDRELLTLARITPPGTFPLATWAGRLSDQNDRRRLAAQMAIHDWLADMAGGGQRIASGKKANGEWRMVQNPLFAIPYSLFPTRQYGQFPELPLLPAITRRQVRQVLRRAGQEGAGNRPVAPFVNLPPEVLPDFRRLREIETALAAGHLPPSPDAGMENRPAPRTVPARLPESHPRTGPPGITGQTTGRTAGSEPPARHPFPETGRHE